MALAQALFMNFKSGQAYSPLLRTTVHENQALNNYPVTRFVGWKSDGSKWYNLSAGSNPTTVTEFSPTTNWDLNSASTTPTTVLTHSSGNSVLTSGILNSDGTIFVGLTDGRRLYVYNLSTAYDFSTASLTQAGTDDLDTFYTSSNIGYLRGLSSGKLWVGYTGSQVIRQFSFNESTGRVTADDGGPTIPVGVSVGLSTGIGAYNEKWLVIRKNLGSIFYAIPRDSSGSIVGQTLVEETETFSVSYSAPAFTGTSGEFLEFYRFSSSDQRARYALSLA